MINGPELWTQILSKFPDGAVIAGGAVRDHMLGIEPKDIDVFIPARAGVVHDPAPTNTTFSMKAFPARFGLDRIYEVFERQAEYAALNNIESVSRGEVFGYTVDAIEMNVDFTGQQLVETFDFGINWCWFDGQINDTPEAFVDRYSKFIILHHHDRLERSLERFARLNERHGGQYVLQQERKAA